MINVRRHLDEFADVGAMNEWINLLAWIDDTTYLTKTGGVGVVYQLTGVDHEGLDSRAQEAIVHRFMSALRPLDERFRVWQYLCKSLLDRFAAPACTNPVAAQILQHRADYLNARDEPLYVLDQYLVVELDGPAPRRTTSRSRAAEKEFIVEEIDRSVARLHHAVRGFETSLADSVRPRRLQKREAFHFLQRLVNFDPMALWTPLVSDDHLDCQLPNSGVRYERDHLEVGHRLVKLLTMKTAPTQTFAHILKDLESVEGTFIACLYWHRTPSAAVRRTLWWREKGYTLQRTISARKSRKQIGQIISAMDHLGTVVGHLSFTLLVHDVSPAAVDDAAATAIKVFTKHDAVLIEETAGSACAWLAMVPGNHAMNVRAARLQMTDLNWADMSFVFTIDQGEAWNPHLNAPYCAAFETNNDTIYRFNLHVRDVGHMLITGRTGSGKSFTTKFLMMHAQQYDPFTVVIDASSTIEGGYRKIAEALGGSYMELGLTPDVTINPFALNDTPANRHFVHGFVKVLIESGAKALEEREDRDVVKAVSAVFALPRDQRQLDALSLSRPLRGRLAKWLARGQFPLFDHVEDTFTLANLQVLDLKAMRSYPELLQPMLFYALHRIHERLGHGFAQIYLDEAWRTIQHPAICESVREIAKTGRSLNASLILITQGFDDFKKSDLLPDVLQQCHTRLYCADQGFDRQFYAERLDLSEAQLDIITHLTPQKQVYLWREGVNKVLTLNVDDRSAWFYSNDSH